MDNFAAIDFETANNERTSVCSVGVVIVKDGEIVDKFYSLIHPEPDYYLYWNTCVHGLTDILIVVVRYFGGIKLGTSGLIVAYKAAAAEAIANATIIEKTVDDEIAVAFEYPFMNDVMRIVKEEEPEILEQSYDMDCLMKLRIRRSMMGKLRARLEKVETARIIE